VIQPDNETIIMSGIQSDIGNIANIAFGNKCSFANADLKFIRSENIINTFVFNHAVKIII
jgi:hypothetical protein